MFTPRQTASVIGTPPPINQVLAGLTNHSFVFVKSIISIILFFFQKKKQKALFRFAESLGPPNLGEADPGGLGACPQKPIGSTLHAPFRQSYAEALLLVENCSPSFSRKRSKKRLSASRKNPTLRVWR
jgi:hypothetical protein